MSGDDRLRALFAALRSRDGREAPDLDDLVARRPVTRPVPLLTRLALPAGLAAALALAVTLFLRPSRPDPGPISRWQSPTASLLQVSSADLMTSTPRVGESWLPIPVEVTK